MELRDYLQLLRRRWISILLITVIAGAAAAGLTALQTPQYSSSARLFVTTAQSSDSSLLQGGQFSAQRVKSYANLIGSRELAQRVITDTGLKLTPETLAAQVSATAVVDTVNLDITVTDDDAHQAQLITQSYAEQLTDLVRELETPTGETQAPIKATIVDAASYSSAPVSPRPKRNIALGLVLGAMLGFGLAVLRNALDTRIRNADELAEAVEGTVLGTIGFDQTIKTHPLVTDVTPHAPRAEAFRVLRTNIQFVDVDQSHKVYVVTSALPEEGKTSTSVNLALSLAQGGLRVLLIEADLRRPRAAGMLGVDGAIGLTNALVGKVEWRDVVTEHESSGLDVLPAGQIPPNPAELLQSQAMRRLLSEARETYDVVLIDSPPLLPVTDAALLADLADGAILVVRYGKTTREQVTHAAERLAGVDAQLKGFVLNMAPVKGRHGSYGYGYGYGYAPDPELSGQEPAQQQA